MGKTSIEWCDFSLNPIRAKRKDGSAVGHYCELASTGCKHCYSSTMQRRFRMPPFGASHRDDVEPYFDRFVLNQVLGRKKPTKFFWCDMTDMFGSWVPDAWIDACLAAMLLTPQHVHQVLTKRAERMQSYFSSGSLYERVLAAADRIRSARPKLCGIGISNPSRFPAKHIWLGVSVENQQCADERIPHLLNTQAAVRFLSCEPLLGPIDLTRVMWPGLAKPGTRSEPHRVDVLRCGYWEDAPVAWRGFVNHSDMPGPINLCIVGGESGSKARPCEVPWIESLVSQCRDARTACFVKQLGAVAIEREPTAEEVRGKCSFEYEWAEGTHFGNRTGKSEYNGRQVLLKDKKGGDWDEWKPSLRVRQFPEVSHAR